MEFLSQGECPDGLRCENLLPVAKYDMSYDPVWEYIHFGCHRTAIGALITLVAC